MNFFFFLLLSNDKRRLLTSGIGWASVCARVEIGIRRNGSVGRRRAEWISGEEQVEEIMKAQHMLVERSG